MKNKTQLCQWILTFIYVPSNWKLALSMVLQAPQQCNYGYYQDTNHPTIDVPHNSIKWNKCTATGRIPTIESNGQSWTLALIELHSIWDVQGGSLVILTVQTIWGYLDCTNNSRCVGSNLINLLHCVTVQTIWGYLDCTNNLRCVGSNLINLYIV